MVNVFEIFRDSIEFLKNHNISSPDTDASAILAHVFHNPDFLFSNLDITSAQHAEITKLLQRRVLHEPLGYILGEVQFLDLTLLVDKRVLIPRLETEELLARVLDKLQDKPWHSPIMFDVCTGSGCMGLSLKKRFNSAQVYLSDISQDCLDLAQKNALRNGLDVEFLKGDLFEPFYPLQADLIVCNPPYISEDDYISLEEEVRLHEPRLALVGGREGDEFYLRLAQDLPLYLRPGGVVILEMGYSQASRIEEIFQYLPIKRKEIMRDLAGIDRFFYLEIE